MMYVKMYALYFNRLVWYQMKDTYGAKQDCESAILNVCLKSMDRSVVNGNVVCRHIQQCNDANVDSSVGGLTWVVRVNVCWNIILVDGYG